MRRVELRFVSVLVLSSLVVTAGVCSAQQRPVPSPDALELARRILIPVLHPLTLAGIIFVVTVFILMQQDDLRDRLIRLFGSRELHPHEQMEPALAHIDDIAGINLSGDGNPVCFCSGHVFARDQRGSLVGARTIAAGNGNGILHGNAVLIGETAGCCDLAQNVERPQRGGLD